MGPEVFSKAGICQRVSFCSFSFPDFPCSLSLFQHSRDSAHLAVDALQAKIQNTHTVSWWVPRKPQQGPFMWGAKEQHMFTVLMLHISLSRSNNREGRIQKPSSQLHLFLAKVAQSRWRLRAAFLQKPLFKMTIGQGTFSDSGTERKKKKDKDASYCF